MLKVNEYEINLEVWMFVIMVKINKILREIKLKVLKIVWGYMRCCLVYCGLMIEFMYLSGIYFLGLYVIFLD